MLSLSDDILVTDDFSIYKGGVTSLKRNSIHVRHIIRPLYQIFFGLQGINCESIDISPQLVMLAKKMVKNLV